MNHRACFSWILTFTQRNLQTSTTHKFLLDVHMNRYIHLKQNFDIAFPEHQILGAHSNVVVFRPQSVMTQYMWTHPGLRPFGHHIPIQCVCGALRSQSPKIAPTLITMKCSWCEHSVEYTPMEGFVALKGKPGSSAGTWVRGPFPVPTLPL